MNVCVYVVMDMMVSSSFHFLLYAKENIPPSPPSRSQSNILKTIGHNTVHMVKKLPPLSPIRKQLIPPITRGLTSTEAATTFDLTRQSINNHRRLILDNAESILELKYKKGTRKKQKDEEKDDAVTWLKDNLTVKSGSAYEVYAQHNTDEEVYLFYKKDMEEHKQSKLSDVLEGKHGSYGAT